MSWLEEMIYQKELGPGCVEMGEGITGLGRSGQESQFPRVGRQGFSCAATSSCLQLPGQVEYIGRDLQSTRPVSVAEGAAFKQIHSTE